jgi:NET1-associated nuclear protein 1 (U3 small nucleolar RNA-associated protein 17)
MADTTPQLKRKRESAIGAQKKAKKSRKSDAVAAQDAGAAEDSAVPTPVDVSATSNQTTPQPKDKSKSASRKPQTNGLRDQDAATTVPSQQNGDGDNAEAKTAAQKALRKQNKKLRALAYQENKSSASGSEAQGTPVRAMSQTHDVDNSVKKKSLQDRITESKQSTRAESLNPETSADESGDEDTTAQLALQAADTSSSAQKSFKERVLEAKEIAEAGSKAQTSVKVKKQKQKQKAAPKWSVSPVQGGWFLPTDPIFSLDEKYIILATLKSLQIYVAETSLLASVLLVGTTGFVTAYALSATKPDQVYVADSNGLITLWNWVDGTKIGRWDIGATVRNMAVVTQPGSDEDLVYCHEAGKGHIVNVHALRTKAQASKTELKRVLKTTSPITNVQVLLQGKYVIISSAETVTVGKRLKASKTAVQDFEYVWRELKFSKRVTTCHMYFRQSEASEKGKKTADHERDLLDLAIGDEEGAVLLFENILSSFAAIEPSPRSEKSRTDSAESFRPKRFHWHRDAVGSVKWSLDGLLIHVSSLIHD